MPIEVLDPTYGDEADPFVEADRPDSLSGLTVALLSNGKQGTTAFFDALEAELRSGPGVGEVVRVTKANYTAPAEAEIMDRAREWHALVAGVGD